MVAVPEMAEECQHDRVVEWLHDNAYSDYSEILVSSYQRFNKWSTDYVAISLKKFP